jgi:hypothetical protein
MAYRTWIRPLNQVIEASHQGDLPSPYNNSQVWEWKDATEDDKNKYGYDKFVAPRIPDMFFRATNPLV